MRKTVFGEGAERMACKFRFLHPTHSHLFTGDRMVAKESRFIDLNPSYHDRMHYHRSNAPPARLPDVRPAPPELTARTRASALCQRRAALSSRCQGEGADSGAGGRERVHADSGHRVQGGRQLQPRPRRTPPPLPLRLPRRPPGASGHRQVAARQLPLADPGRGAGGGVGEGGVPAGGADAGRGLRQVQQQLEHGLRQGRPRAPPDPLAAAMASLKLGAQGAAEEGTDGLGAIVAGSEEEEEEEEEDLFEGAQATWYGHCGGAPAEAHFPGAFSHLSHQMSKGSLLVVDLQRVFVARAERSKVYELTDPVIHKKHSKRRFRKWTFGRTDRGNKGMRAFFATRRCSDSAASST